MSDDTRRSVEFKEKLELAQAIERLEDIVRQLKEGVVTLEEGAETLTIRPDNSVTLEVKAKRKGEKQSLQFELKWRRTPAKSESEEHEEAASELTP